MKVVGAVRRAAILDACTANALENTVELLVADMETVVMALEPLGLVKVERQCFCTAPGFLDTSLSCGGPD